MSVEIDYTIDKDLRIDSKGVSMTRERMFFANDVLELYRSGILPMIKSSHPGDSRFRLKSSSVSSAGEKGGIKQFLWKGEYATQQLDGREWGVDKDPWDLGARNVKMQISSTQEPMNYGYAEDGHRVDIANTAGSVLNYKHNVYGMTLTFEFASKREPNVNNWPFINDKGLTVAGHEIDQHCGLLLPITYTPVVDKDDQGNITRSYYNVSVQIKVIIAYGESWERFIENKGTLAIPRNGDQRCAQPLYIYSDPDTTNLENMEFKIKKKIGTLDEVIAAKNEYANKKTEEKYGEDWKKNPVLKEHSEKENSTNKNKLINEAQQFWEQKHKELPWEEVKEPVDLDRLGHVDLELFEDPKAKDTVKISFFEHPLSNWSQYNLPKNAEGF
jgi:hypothetical protein